jgi:hypothetical protein
VEKCYNCSAMAKTILDMTSQELLKMFVNDVGELIDARIRTAEITIKANTDAAIKASEERIKSELRQDINASETNIRKDMATKEDIQRLEQKLDKKIADHEERIEQLKEESLSRGLCKWLVIVVNHGCQVALL